MSYYSLPCFRVFSGTSPIEIFKSCSNFQHWRIREFDASDLKITANNKNREFFDVSFRGEFYCGEFLNLNVVML